MHKNPYVKNSLQELSSEVSGGAKWLIRALAPDFLVSAQYRLRQNQIYYINSAADLKLFERAALRRSSPIPDQIPKGGLKVKQTGIGDGKWPVVTILNGNGVFHDIYIQLDWRSLRLKPEEIGLNTKSCKKAALMLTDIKGFKGFPAP